MNLIENVIIHALGDLLTRKLAADGYQQAEKVVKVLLSNSEFLSFFYDSLKKQLQTSAELTADTLSKLATEEGREELLPHSPELVQQLLAAVKEQIPQLNEVRQIEDKN